MVIAPLVIAFLGIFMGLLAMVGGQGKTQVLPFAVVGGFVGIFIMTPVYWFVMHRLKKGRISKVIKKTAKFLEMDDQEMETLGMDMLAALQGSSCHLDYQEKVPHGQKTPARLLVSRNFFYQTGSGMRVILIRRSDVDYIEAGQEYKTVRQSSSVSHSVILYAVYFYYHSSRERRLEMDRGADNGMGFFDPAIRDRAFAMIDRQLNAKGF